MCGIVGVMRVDNSIVHDLADGLKLLQHRARNSAGISVSQNGAIKDRKGHGLVHFALQREGRGLLEDLPGAAGIGHVRWPTHGKLINANIQPLGGIFRGEEFRVAHNGEICLRGELKKEFADYQPDVTSDTKFITGLIARSLKSTFEEALGGALAVLRGTYSLLLLYRDQIYAVRDVTANRPLVVGKKENTYMIASESCAFYPLGFSYQEEIGQGEIFIFSRNPFGYVKKLIPEIPFDVPRAMKQCLFEYIYLLRPDSILLGRLVESIRRQMGHILWQECPAEADIVVGVPDSGVAAALGLAKASGILYEPAAILRDHYTGRVFISEKDMREKNILMKFIPFEKYIRGKRCLLVDDSIIEGITIKKIIKILWEMGAREVHVRISSPPIINPCYYRPFAK